MRIVGRCRSAVRVVAASAVLAVLAAASIPRSAVAAPVSSPAADEPRPFARVYLALRGCTSCAHCRTSIRQMVNAKSEGGVARVRGDQVEVRYPKPKTLPLRAVIRNLADNRLHDLSLVDVLFEARGTLVAGPGGTTLFRLPGTSQSFPVTIDRSVPRPPDGSPLRLVALVDGWRNGGELTLVARELHREG